MRHWVKRHESAVVLGHVFTCALLISALVVICIAILLILVETLTLVRVNHLLVTLVVLR